MARPFSAFNVPLNARLVSTHLRERRPSAAELARMDPWEQARMDALYPRTDEELYDELRRDVLDLDELSYLEQHEPPANWDNPYGDD